MEHPGVSELRPSKSAPTIHVRVLRSWVPDYRDNELPFLLVDQEGLGIQAVTKENDCTNVRSRLQIQRCYEISRYACVAADDFTAVITHPAMIKLGSASVLTPIADTQEFPTQYFDFATRRKMEIEAKKERGIVDFIGIYLKLEDKTSKKGRPYVVFTLRDISNQDMSVALWKEIATSTHRFNRRNIETAASPAIVAFTSLKVNDQNDLQLQSTNATYVFVNPHHLEAELLKEMWQNQEPHHPALQIMPDNYVPIADLLQLQTTEIEGRTFNIKAEITETETTKGWSYTACPKCNQSVLQVNTQWFCTRDAMQEKANTMYRIFVTLSDNTERIKAVIFDHAGRQLLGLTCEELAEKEDPINTLYSLMAKEALMSIQLQHDKRMRTLKCLVNKASYPVVENIEATSSSVTDAIKTPAPTTPGQKGSTATRAKRQLEFDDSDPTLERPGKRSLTN
ncbi:putative nucleic acid-binding, replication factor A [Helianthus annuus]|nr:putative nucleic acid-binding, replication factor A [Helianthus annuus]